MADGRSAGYHDVTAEEFDRLLTRPREAVVARDGEQVSGVCITFGSGACPTTCEVGGVRYRLVTDADPLHAPAPAPVRKRARDVEAPADAAAAATAAAEMATARSLDRERRRAAVREEAARVRETASRERDSIEAKAIARGVPLTSSDDSCSVSQRGVGPGLSPALFMATWTGSADVDDSVGSALYTACVDAMCAQAWLPSPPGFVRTATGRGVGAAVGSWSFPAGREPRLAELAPRLMEELRTMGPPQRVGDSPLHCVFSPYSLLVRVAGHPHAVDIFDDPKVVRAWQDRLLRDAVVAALGTPAQRAPAAFTDTVTFRGTVLHVGTVIALPPTGEIVPYPAMLSALDTIKAMGNAVLGVPCTSRPWLPCAIVTADAAPGNVCVPWVHPGTEGPVHPTPLA